MSSSVIVLEASGARTWFDVAGESSRRNRVPLDGWCDERFNPLPEGLLHDGGLLLRCAERMFGLADGEYRQTAGLLRVGDGRADTIGWFPADTGRTDIGEVPVPRPYLPTAEILWASSPGAVFVVSAGSADLSAHRTGQATPLRFTTSAVPTRVTDDDVAETVDDALRMISGTNDRRVVGEWFEGMPRATVAPPIRSILVDSDGNPWVESWQRSDGRARWTIYSSDGRTLATLSTPAGSELLSVGPDWALGLRRDEYGVEQVTLFRLRRTS